MIAPEWEPEFEAFVREQSPRLLGFAFLLTGDRSEAEDLLQTALLRVAKRWSAARESPNLFARRVAVNLAHDRRRHRRRRPAETPFEEWMGDSVSGDETQRRAERELLLRAVRRLPSRQRAVLVLRFWEDMSVEQTAFVLGCGEGSVKSHTHRALAQLRLFMGQDDSRAGSKAPGSPTSMDTDRGGASCQAISK
jgi:RNA polymerase sigma-70 factor (sigma-E family)